MDSALLVITSPDFRRGQAAARADFRKDPDATPVRALLERVSPEFFAGYRYEWNDHLLPFHRALTARQAHATPA